MSTPIPINSGRTKSKRNRPEAGGVQIPPFEVLTYRRAPAVGQMAKRLGLFDLAFTSCGIRLHDCPLFEGKRDGKPQLSIGLPSKLGDDGNYSRAVTWLETKSDLVEAAKAAILDALVEFTGGAL